ncbi:hypothetical protein FAM09_16835 [Niastella caeni]|uniref:Uncharacterized protein n=1 Tax=Niastella caeni TaxID=2569763 RepID=A0A4S8HTI2_9BACT|nr:hypothetical protein [Niastella caeni]THU38341.1 hypothetical protein FAM09_16835 [Niastella caeni]
MKPLSIFSLMAIIFIAACNPSANDPGKPTPILKGSIDVKTAKRLVKNFEPRSYHETGEYGFFDTRCVWFSIEQLDTLVQKIKHENGDGIRFYLAAYDKDSAIHNKSVYRNHSTLVMVSTFDTVVIRDSKREHKHWDYYGKSANGIDAGAILTTDPENRGELCPPPATCGEEGATLFKP